mgnify:CR=1 FL=1
MPKIPVDNLKPGMKLARPLLNSSGMVLMAEGTELTEARISKIENMGVDNFRYHIIRAISGAHIEMRCFLLSARSTACCKTFTLNVSRGFL